MKYTFKIKLKGSTKPPIWRRVQMNSHITFLEFHFIIQGVFQWWNAHLFKFSKDGYRSYPQLDSNPEFEGDMISKSDASTWPYEERYEASEIAINQYFKDTVGRKITYIYDFGDDWYHEITLEKVEEGNIIKPICTGGKGKAPIEDIGGLGGHYHFVEVINGPHNQERKEMLKWLEEPKSFRWDENEFDLEQVNVRLSGVWEEVMKNKNT